VTARALLAPPSTAQRDALRATLLYAHAAYPLYREQMLAAGVTPALIEAVCYRYRGHFEGDAEEYRTKEEVELWRALDPIPRLGNRLKKLGWADDAMLDFLRAEAQRAVEQAVAFAEQSPLPDPAEALTGVFR